MTTYELKLNSIKCSACSALISKIAKKYNAKIIEINDAENKIRLIANNENDFANLKNEIEKKLNLNLGLYDFLINSLLKKQSFEFEYYKIIEFLISLFLFSSIIFLLISSNIFQTKLETYLALFILAIATSFSNTISDYIKKFHEKIDCNVAMMCGMTMSMSTSSIFGGIFGLTNGLYIGAILGTLIGLAYGIRHSCRYSMAYIESVLGSFMGGTMGAMLIVMLLYDNVFAFLFFINLIQVTSMTLLAFLIRRDIYGLMEHDNENLSKLERINIKNIAFSVLVFIFLIIILLVLPKGHQSIFTLKGD